MQTSNFHYSVVVLERLAVSRFQSSTMAFSEFRSARMLFRAHCVVALERKLDMRQVLPT